MGLVAVLLLVVVALLAVLLFVFSTRSSALLQLKGDVEAVGARLTNVDVRVSGIVERVHGVSDQVNGVASLQTSSMQGLNTLYSEVSAARASVSDLRGQGESRAGTDRQVAESMRRLETIIAGTHSKGAAGENIVNMLFSQLPVQWQRRDFQINNRTVEFAVEMSNGRVLPIDSKWPATELIERLGVCTNPKERAQLKDQIGRAVVTKAREVKKYLEPTLTLGFGIAAVPDAVYDISTEVHGACIEENVVLIGYSMLLPYVLLTYQTVLATSKDLDVEQLNSNLHAVDASVAAMQLELEGRLSRAITMLQNSKAELGAHLQRVRTSLSNVYTGARLQRQLPEPEIVPVAANDQAS